MLFLTSRQNEKESAANCKQSKFKISHKPFRMHMLNVLYKIKRQHNIKVKKI